MANKTTTVKFSATTYIKHRKNMLKDEMRMVFLRDKINKDLRDIRKSMAAWDRYLIR